MDGVFLVCPLTYFQNAFGFLCKFVYQNVNIIIILDSKVIIIYCSVSLLLHISLFKIPHL